MKNRSDWVKRGFTSNIQLFKVLKTNTKELDTSDAHCVWIWNVNFSLGALCCNCVFSLMPPNLLSIVIMLSSNKHIFFRIKENMQFHTMEYLVVLCVLGWVCSPLLERVNTFNFVCVCACVLGRRSRGLRPEMGWVLLSSLNYLAHGGVCEWAPTPDFTGDCRAECTVFMTMSPPLWCFHKV